MPARATGLSEPASRNIEAIASLEREARLDRSRLDRVTDAITTLAGSPAFIIGHALWFAIWIAVNTTRTPPFDPYPFGLLMLIVSLEAIFLSAAVLMTQNHMQRIADKRAHLDLQVNLLAEQELTTMLKMLTQISQRLGVEVAAADPSVEQHLKDTNIQTISDALDRELSDPTAPSSAPARHTP